MANQSVPNQQITTYTHNGFRNDVNKVNMPFGKGMPLQNVFNFLVSPVLDSGNGSICAVASFNAAGQPLNTDPQGTVATLAPIPNLTLLQSLGTQANGSYIPLNPVAADFISQNITIQLTLAGPNGPVAASLFVSGYIAPGVLVSETVNYAGTVSSGTVILSNNTEYAYIAINSILVEWGENTTQVTVTGTNPTVSSPGNATLASLLNPPLQSGLVAGSSLSLSAVASQFPSQNFWINVSSSGAVGGNVNILCQTSSGLKTVIMNLNGTNLDSRQVGASVTSVTSIQIDPGATLNNATLSVSIAVQVTEAATLYKTINGQNMIQLDCQRCIQIALIPSGTKTPRDGTTVLISGYDDRFVQVQETLSLPSPGSISAPVYFTSNKAYSYIQSIIFNQNPSPTPTLTPNAVSIAVSCSNQFFGLPFYFSNDGVMTVEVPSIDGLDGALTPAVQIGNNFYANVPDASQSAPLNTFSGTNPLTTISTLDARGIFALSGEITSNQDILSYVAYIYAADSFVNAQLQNAPANSLAQQQVSNWVTQTQGAVVNDPDYTGWTQNNWATTQLIDFDLTGAQFPGDQEQFNQIFGNTQLPGTVSRRMGTALTAPSTT